jgi:hypothetical protein
VPRFSGMTGNEAVKQFLANPSDKKNNIHIDDV